MSCAEHYFENLLFYGKDVRDEPNKKHLSEIEEKTIRMCYYYVAYTLFGCFDNFDDFMVENHHFYKSRKVNREKY